MWDLIRDRFSFTGVVDITVWQDIIFSSFLIPIVLGMYKLLVNYWVRTRPLNLLLNGFGNKTKLTLVFLSQLHSCEKDGSLIHDQKYFVLSPSPMPGIKNVMRKHMRQNIDPVWSEGDGECLADIYNVFGKSNKGENIRIADTILDWSEWAESTISIGFNPKSEKLIEKCDPIYFELKGDNLAIPKLDISLDSFVPNDAGIIQKTFIKNSDTPVLILAGLGTLGTSAAGYYFKKECISLGKLYGSEPFCVLFNVKSDEGRTSVYPIGIYPKPSIINRFLHPLSYFKKMKLFSSEVKQT